MVRYKIRKSGHRTVVTDRVTPTQLRQRVAHKAGVSEVEASSVIEALGDVIHECLSQGNSVAISSIGVFYPRLLVSNEVSTLFRTAGRLRRLDCGIKEITNTQE